MKGLETMEFKLNRALALLLLCLCMSESYGLADGDLASLYKDLQPLGIVPNAAEMHVMEEADKLIDAWEIDAALAHMEKEVRTNPGSAFLWHALGEDYRYWYFDRSKANVCYQKAYKADPNFISSMLSYIYVCADEGNTDLGLKLCEQVYQMAKPFLSTEEKNTSNENLARTAAATCVRALAGKVQLLLLNNDTENAELAMDVLSGMECDSWIPYCNKLDALFSLASYFYSKQDVERFNKYSGAYVTAFNDSYELFKVAGQTSYYVSNEQRSNAMRINEMLHSGFPPIN